MNKEEKREYDKKYRLINKDKRRESEIRYRIKHKKELVEKNKLYRFTNNEKEKLRHRKYKINNKLKIKEYNKQWREINREIKRNKDKEYKLNNKEKIKEQTKKDTIKNKEKNHQKYLKQKEIIIKRSAKFRIEHPEKIKIYRNKYKRKHNKEILNKRKTNPLLKLNHSIGNALNKSLKNIGCKKEVGWKISLGYNNIELKNHLERQFTPEMSWNNYGTYWHIDHIIPLSWFKTEEQLIKKGWKLQNLQPLEANINIEKSNNFVGNQKSNDEIIYL